MAINASAEKEDIRRRVQRIPSDGESLPLLEDEKDTATHIVCGGGDTPSPLTTEDDETRASSPPDSVPQPTCRSTILVTIPVFAAYALLLSLQAVLKKHIGITDKGSRDSYIYGVAVSSLFFAGLAFRFFHNFFLGFLRPRHRITLALLVTSASLWVVFGTFYGFNHHTTPSSGGNSSSSSSSSNSSFTALYDNDAAAAAASSIPLAMRTRLAVVFIVFLSFGAALGTFEANIVSVVTPLGPKSKEWAILGMPIGYNGAAMGGFALLATVPDSPIMQGVCFAVIAVAALVSVVVFTFLVPDSPYGASEETISETLRKLKLWRQWVPLIWRNALAIFIDMFVCILGGSLILYIFNGDRVSLVGHGHLEVSSYTLQAIVNFGCFVGDFSSRYLTYSPPRWYPNILRAPQNGNPLRFNLFSLVGFGLAISNVGLLAPFGMLLIMFGNGAIYATTTQHIDAAIASEFNLAAVSLWLFVGDAGSNIASELVTPLQNLL